MKNRGQVTIFIILAILIVALVALFFIFKDKIIPGPLNSDFSKIHNTLLSCLEEDLQTGVYLLESQGGYIYLPDFEAGSSYMPFSSQLNFLGNYVPYWYYVSGNGIPEEQVPSKTEMEKDLEKFMEEKVKYCVFNNYYEEGYEINIGEPVADILIEDEKVFLNLKMNFDMAKDEESASVENHKVIFESELGNLYNSALEVYEEEQKTLFLENYSIDVLRMYAPVDGVELTCSPKVWEANSVFNDLQDAIEANILALKNKGDEEDYFALNLPIKEDVRFLNSQTWPYSFEVSPSEENFLMAEPIGNQAGMGVLGFCYVTYHFVYNLKYPILVQVVSGEEIFQFPVAVVILGNTPRKPLSGSAIGAQFSEFCDNKNTLASVILLDSDMRKIDGNVSYECFGTSCLIGETEGGEIYEKFPQCVNGYIVASAEGYKEEKLMQTITISGSSISVFLDRLYEKNINLKLDGKVYSGEATITFISDDSSSTIFYPSQKKVELSEGEYEVQVSIYKNASLNFAGGISEQCVEVPKGGIGALLGLTEEQCFEIEYPPELISSALAGGGTQEYSFSEYSLRNSNTIEINAESFPAPNSFEQLQENYILFENSGLEVELR
jgi:hypothetical protein